MMIEGEEFVEGGIFSGEGVRPHRSSVSSELLNMLLHVRPGRWWRGNFPGRELVRKEGEVRHGEFVTSELLNTLLHATPGRWWRGNFPGKEFVPKGRGSSSVEFLRLFGVVQYTTDCI